LNELDGAHPLVGEDKSDDLIVVGTDPAQVATTAVDDHPIADGPDNSREGFGLFAYVGIGLAPR